MVAMLFSLLAVTPAMAHEIGTTRVTVRFPTADTFRITIVTDGQALLEKLSSLHRGVAKDRHEDRQRFDALRRVFLERVVITFDAQVVQPAVKAVFAEPIDETAPSLATVTLAGHVPPHARQLTWTYGWTFSTYSLEIQQRLGASRMEWLDGGEESTPILLDASGSPARATIVWQYLRLGFTHIVPKGLDHILFVLGLFLLNAGWRILLLQISAFTLAHTLTLGLAMNGLVAARPSIVEPLIALSIAYVAIENIFSAKLQPWRIALVFAFGLLHGLGFAGVLRELGLPSGQFIPALVAFNLGVEAGQLTVISAAILAVGWWRSTPSYRQRVVIPASLGIACVAVFWTAQRLAY
jgi:hypothetical protein